MVSVSDSGACDVGSNPTSCIRSATGNALLERVGPQVALAHCLDFSADQIGISILLFYPGWDKGFRRVDPVNELAGFLVILSFKNFLETSA